FLVLIDNQPLVYFPINADYLLFFSALTVGQNWLQQQRNGLLAVDRQEGQSNITVDWLYFTKSLTIMIVPKMIGVLGLLTLPANLMTGIIFVIVGGYAFSYIFNKPFKSNHPALDTFFLVLGAYISGTSLIGAPLIIAVFATHVAKHLLRDTLFVLWFILVTIKMATFIYAGVDLRLIHHLWLLPAAAVGHVIGLRFHKKIALGDAKIFYRWLGVALLAVSLFGMVSLFVKH